MEFWDILNSDRTKSGRTKRRGETLDAGEFHLAVHVWIRSPQNEFVVSKRASNKIPFPGLWEPSGGAVQAGESSLNAAIREVQEEIGISLPPSEGRLIAQLSGEGQYSHTLSDVWLFDFDFSRTQLSTQSEEVAEVALVNSNEFALMISDGKVVPYVAKYWPQLAGIPNRKTSGAGTGFFRVHTADLAWATQKPRGLFVAVGKLVESKTTTADETSEYWDTRHHFEAILPVPDFYKEGNPDRAITYYKDNEAGRSMLARMDFYFKMARKYQLKLFRTTVFELPGRLIYEDEFQIAVVPYGNVPEQVAEVAET